MKQKVSLFFVEIRKISKVIKNKNFNDKTKDKIEIIEIDLFNLNENLNRIKNFENDISGIFLDCWIHRRWN